MTTIRNVTKRHGFSMPWATAQDGKRIAGGLSFEARGVLAYLLSKPDDWVIQIEDLMAEGGIGRDKVKNILKELRDAKYLATEMRHDENGRFVGKSERLHEVSHRNTEIQYYGDRDTENPSNGKSSERIIHPIHNKENTQKKEKIAAAEAVGDQPIELTPEQLFDQAAKHNKSPQIIPLVVEEKPKRTARPNPHFDAIVAAFKFDRAHLTKTEAGGIGKVAAELKAAGYTPEDIPQIHAYCVRKGYEGFTPAALAKHAAAWRATQQKSAASGLSIFKSAEAS
jgi:hypothetical protein